ncbi:MAG: hypothetical protein ACQERD_00975 [Campylobacterota bacterium]
MLPALALAGSFSPSTGLAVAGSVAGFFTYLYQQNLKDEDTNSFTYSGLDTWSEQVKHHLNHTVTQKTDYKQVTNESINLEVTNYLSALPVEQNHVSKNVSTQPILSNNPSILESMKSQTLENEQFHDLFIEQQKIMNNNLLAINKTMVSLADIQSKNYVSQDGLNTLLLESLPGILQSLTNLGSLPKVIAESNDISHILDSETIGKLTDIETHLSKLEQTLNQKDMSPTVNNSVNNSVDTTPIANETAKIATATETLAHGVDNQILTNEKISSGVDNQILTNQKIVEKSDLQIDDLKFYKDGSSNLTDSSGNQIKPREVKAKNNAENAIYRNLDNQIPYGDLIPTDTEIAEDEADSNNIMQLVLDDFLDVDITKIDNIDNNKGGNNEQI